MKIRFPWNKKVNPGSVEGIERLLHSTLTPVSPRSAFVTNLRHKLVDYEARPSLLPDSKKLRYGLLGLAGVVSAALMIFTGIRTIISILSALGLLREMRRQMEEKRKSTPTLAH